MTLVELMIVLAITALLAGSALGAWHKQVLRAQRADASGTLLQAALAQERHRLQHQRYADSLPGPPPAGLGIADVTPRGHYSISLEAADPEGWRLTARLRAGHARPDPDCVMLALDHLGLRHARDAQGREDRGTALACWR